MKISSLIFLILFCQFLGAATVPVQQDIEVDAHGLKVHVVGTGPDALADVKAVLDQQTALTTDKNVTEPLADDLAFFVRQRYFELGYRDVVVNWEIAGDAVLLRVDEGVKYLVGVVTYEGNKSQIPSELTKYLLRPTHEKLNTSTDHPPCVEADLRAGADLVKRYFQAAGYIEATVAEPVFSAHPDSGTVDVLLRIKEGRRYIFGEACATGDLQGLDKAVRKELNKLSGQNYNEIVLENTRKAVLAIYQQKGRFSATVSVIAHPSNHPDGIVPSEFQVLPGPEYRIENVKVMPGFSAGAQRLIHASFKTADGRKYLPWEIDIMTRRLLDTEVFARLDVKPVSVGANTLTLDITGEEAKRITLSAYGGYDTFQGPILGVEDRQVNFMDSGNAIRIKAEINGHGYEGALKFLNPALFNSAWAFETELSAQTFDLFDYNRRTFRERSSLNRRWTRHITSSFFLDVSSNLVESEKLTAMELGPTDYKIGTAGAAITLDYRDSPVIPTKGWYAGGTLSQTSGSDINFLRSDAVFSYYQPIVKHVRAAFTAHTSALNSNSGIDGVPIDLRLFNGGATSVRSFAEREMGDHSKSGTPLGGTLAQVFSAELSYEFASNFELAVFGDAGRISPMSINPFSASGELSYAIGAGLRYKLPFGPLRIDYGYNPKRKEGEAMGALHITFGFAF